jgi:hypothetical protein
MMITTHEDTNGNPCMEDVISWDQDDLQKVLAEPAVNREEVLNSIRQHARSDGGTRWEVVGGIETLRRLNLTYWVDLVKAMHTCVSEMNEEELERYRYRPDG